VACKVHGATVAEVPWARHGVGFTRDFEDQVAWLAVHSSKKAIVELMRIAWRTVGSIVERISPTTRGRAVTRWTGSDGSGSMRSRIVAGTGT
jgi:transposase